MDINNILKNIFNDILLQDKYTIKLKEKTITIIIQILNNNPEFFYLIENIFNEIISNNLINIFNFSILSKYILEIYNSFIEIKYIEHLFDIEIFCNLLNFIFCVL